jgi:biotin carboxyl carrier protein
MRNVHRGVGVMQFQIEVGERIRNVVVQREGDRYTVTIDGRAHTVDARRLDSETLSMLVAPRDVTAADASEGQVMAADAAQGNTVKHVEAAIVPGREAGAFTINVNGHGVPVQLRIGGAGRRGRDSAAAAGAGPQKVKAPMSGKVVRVLVKPGDEVKAKQGLVVVEAMKMENELKAARAGRVRDVLVSEGRSVDAGAVLVIVE